MTSVSSLQDPFMKKAQNKLLNSRSWPSEFSEKVDMTRISFDAIRPWIESRITQILGDEDEIVYEYCVAQLEAFDPVDKSVDPRMVQINLEGFLGMEGAGVFTWELWNLLLSAQLNPVGVPEQLVNQATVSTLSPLPAIKQETIEKDDRRSLRNVDRKEHGGRIAKDREERRDRDDERDRDDRRNRDEELDREGRRDRDDQRDRDDRRNRDDERDRAGRRDKDGERDRDDRRDKDGERDRRYKDDKRDRDDRRDRDNRRDRDDRRDRSRDRRDRRRSRDDIDPDSRVRAEKEARRRRY